ncbi:MAG: imelysin family protein [Sulfitobacter sp.]
MKHILVLIVALIGAPATADVTDAVNRHILPGYADFAEASENLSVVAQQDCSPEAVRPAWNMAFDAWLGVSHLHFGPVEAKGRSVTIAFWPDERGAGARALASLIAGQDPVIETAEGTAQVSAAARGLFGLEYLLYDPQFADAGAYGCDLIRALSADLAAIADATLADWSGGYAEQLRTAGSPENRTFLTAREGTQALFTSLISGLEFTTLQRLGRPMGTFDRPRPNRAEARRSARSLRNVDLSLRAMRNLTVTLTNGAAPATLAAFDRALTLVAALGDPDFSTVATPQGRLKVEVIQQAVHAIEISALTEIGPSLGVSAGFNSADGD